jgi:TolB-like protein/tetratricopeptide (TPR) repeat protein
LNAFLRPVRPDSVPQGAMKYLIEIARAKKLDRVAIGYTIAAWAVIQAAAMGSSAFDWPQWALQAVIVVAVAGLPAVLIGAWTFAVRKETGAFKPSRADLHVLGILGIVLAVAAVLLVTVFWPREKAAPAMMASSAAPGAPARSVAVLPFNNLSGDPNKRYFSDGISDELINALSRLPSLRVAARTSSFAFEGKSEDVKTIAHALNVRTVLDGSVREDGNHVRISAELVNASDGFPIWSDSYDRDLTDILTLEDDIARAITQALTHKLLGVPATGRPKAIDPNAYRKYLEGQYFLGPRTEDGVARAVALFKQVTALQPDFADSFAALGRALINHAENHPEQKDLMPAAQAALDKALTLDPDNLEALAAHLDLALHRLDWQTAAADARRMEAINPNSATVLHEMFRYYQLLGFPHRALATVRGVVTLNPLSFVDRYNVVAALIHNGQYADAIDAAHEALALEPNQTEVLAMLCTAEARTNHLADAHAILLQLLQGNDETSRTGCQFDIAIGEGRLADARKIADGLASQFPQGDFGAADIGESYAQTDDFGQAAQWFARAYEGRGFALFTVAYSKDIPPAFFKTAGWKALSQRPLFKDWQTAHDKLAAELAAQK